MVFDPNAFRDTATFETPDRFPTGIDHVFINGAHVLDGDEYDASARAGKTAYLFAVVRVKEPNATIFG